MSWPSASASRPRSTAISGFISRRTPITSSSLRAARGAGVILHLERGPHRIHRDDALQFERQRGDREFGVLEFFARVRPFFLPREGKALPQLGIVTVADRRIGEILQRPLGMADEDAGDRMHHQHGSLFATLLGLGEDEVGDAPRFLIHPARHVEIGKLETGRRLCFGPARRKRP